MMLLDKAWGQNQTTLYGIQNNFIVTVTRYGMWPHQSHPGQAFWLVALVVVMMTLIRDHKPNMSVYQ